MNAGSSSRVWLNPVTSNASTHMLSLETAARSLKVVPIVTPEITDRYPVRTIPENRLAPESFAAASRAEPEPTHHIGHDMLSCWSGC